MSLTTIIHGSYRLGKKTTFKQIAQRSREGTMTNLTRRTVLRTLAATSTVPLIGMPHIARAA